jgi:hypothetical protein
VSTDPVVTAESYSEKSSTPPRPQALTLIQLVTDMSQAVKNIKEEEPGKGETKIHAPLKLLNKLLKTTIEVTAKQYDKQNIN